MLAEFFSIIICDILNDFSPRTYYSPSLRYHRAYLPRRTPSRKDPVFWARSSFVVGSTCSSKTPSCYLTRNLTRWRRRRCGRRDRRRSWAVATCLSCQRDSAARDLSILRYRDRQSSVSAADEDCWMVDRMPPISAACRGWCLIIWSTTSPSSRREAAWTRSSRMPRGCSNIGAWPLPNYNINEDLILREREDVTRKGHREK